MSRINFPAEWYPQSGVQLTWPDCETEWEPFLPEVIECYRNIANEIAKRETLVIVCRDKEQCLSDLQGIPTNNIIFKEIELNDTWARDHGGISVFGPNGEKIVLDFIFNGWGLKFHADLDNQITKQMFEQGTFQDDVIRKPMNPFVLEGGSIDSDGQGTMLTTRECLCSLNRNEHMSQEEIDTFLKEQFGLDRILWVNHGAIVGDDTDSHVDTLVRFCNENTIAYVQCENPEDEHYEELKAMEEQLKTFRTKEGKPYNLVPLPLPEALYLEDYRLPATYVNFLIMNGAVLMPGCGAESDKVAAERLQAVFPDREVVTINCTALLSGHGSLHCVTMQFPEGFINA